MANNTLNYAEKKALDAWITKHWDTLVRSNADYKYIATQASAELKITFKDTNVKSLLGVMGKELPNVRRVEHVDAVARRAIADLYNQMGSKIPEDILPYLAKDSVKNG